MRKPRAQKSKAADSGAIDSMAQMSELLMTQVLTLDDMFVELVDHAAKNFQAWPGPTHRYMGLALRAQSNCRSSLMAMAKAQREMGQGQDAAAE